MDLNYTVKTVNYSITEKYINHKINPLTPRPDYDTITIVGFNFMEDSMYKCECGKIRPSTQIRRRNVKRGMAVIEFNIGDKIRIIDDGGMFVHGNKSVEYKLKNFKNGYGNGMDCSGMIGTIIVKDEENKSLHPIYGVRLQNGIDIVISNDLELIEKEQIFDVDLFKVE